MVLREGDPVEGRSCLQNVYNAFVAVDQLFYQLSKWSAIWTIFLKRHARVTVRGPISNFWISSDPRRSIFVHQLHFRFNRNLILRLNCYRQFCIPQIMRNSKQIIINWILCILLFDINTNVSESLCMLNYIWNTSSGYLFVRRLCVNIFCLRYKNIYELQSFGLLNYSFLG